jgi:flagellar hook-associated protein 1 FlgK
MIGLFGTLDMGTRALQAQRQGVEVTGQNLANVNNPAYARQRLIMRTSSAVASAVGPQGTGVQAVSIQQLRDLLTDGQIRGENSVSGFLTRKQSALQNAQAQLGETLLQDSETGAVTGVSTSGSNGILSQINNLFNSFQGLSNDPTSATNRQAVLGAAQELATRLNSADGRLSNLSQTLNESITSETGNANSLLKDLADLNLQIMQAEGGSSATANDLRDLRQQKLEGLASLVDFNTSENPDGSINITADGNLLVDGKDLVDRLEAYDSGSGKLQLRTAKSGAPVNLTGGSIQGAIDTRDGALNDLKSQLDTLAEALVSEVNSIHTGGYNLNGTTGAAFFTGSTAADIAVNTALVADPRKLQASGDPAAVGDNQVALSLARLATQPIAALGQQTFAQQYTTTVTSLGQALQSTNTSMEDQALVQSMLQGQRDAVSGVSLDEEMTNMMKYQKAFEASAKLVATVSEMLDDIINLKR